VLLSAVPHSYPDSQSSHSPYPTYQPIVLTTWAEASQGKRQNTAVSGSDVVPPVIPVTSSVLIEQTHKSVLTASHHPVSAWFSTQTGNAEHCPPCSNFTGVYSPEAIAS
jgi:hypothetical protein